MEAIRYKTPITTGQRLYGGLATLIILAFSIEMLLVDSAASLSMRMGFAALLVTNAACLAWLFEGKPWALALEAARATIILGALTAGVWLEPVSAAARMAGGLALLASLAGLAVLLRERSHSSYSTGLESA